VSRDSFSVAKTLYPWHWQGKLDILGLNTSLVHLKVTAYVTVQLYFHSPTACISFARKQHFLPLTLQTRIHIVDPKLHQPLTAKDSNKDKNMEANDQTAKEYVYVHTPSETSILTRSSKNKTPDTATSLSSSPSLVKISLSWILQTTTPRPNLPAATSQPAWQMT
jgi:hypothetical protein